MSVTRAMRLAERLERRRKSAPSAWLSIRMAYAPQHYKANVGSCPTSAHTRRPEKRTGGLRVAAPVGDVACPPMLKVRRRLVSGFGSPPSSVFAAVVNCAAASMSAAAASRQKVAASTGLVLGLSTGQCIRKADVTNNSTGTGAAWPMEVKVLIALSPWDESCPRDSLAFPWPFPAVLPPTGGAAMFNTRLISMRGSGDRVSTARAGPPAPDRTAIGTCLTATTGDGDASATRGTFSPAAASDSCFTSSACDTLTSKAVLGVRRSGGRKAASGTLGKVSGAHSNKSMCEGGEGKDPTRRNHFSMTVDPRPPASFSSSDHRLRMASASSVMATSSDVTSKLRCCRKPARVSSGAPIARSATITAANA
mmetsp:Transcript_5180/g.14589  ORF Transcript_5180/g.14589 Transcript_5180/m.14589 type:complete len:366 (-) Transcript_5180:744-1841(-)